MTRTIATSLRIGLACSQVAVVVLLLIWIIGYLQGPDGRSFALGPVGTSAGNDTGALFNLHPCAMVAAFLLFMLEALLAYKNPALNRSTAKTRHAALHAIALVLAALGITAAWKSHTLKKPMPTPNLYSGHSWLGVLTFGMVVAQITAGALIYIYPKLALSTRAAVRPYHQFAGLATWIVALATMLTGIQEKSTFVQAFGKVGVYEPGIRLPAVLQLSIAVTGVLAVALIVLVPTAKQAEQSPNVQYERVV